jgi:threonine/homoserine/homoserine lactone efflux protein
MLLTFFLKGIVVGIVIAVPVGPVGVLCVRRTIFEGRLVGFLSGLGAASADTIFGIVAAFGLGVISSWLFAYENWLRAAGGLFLLYVGIAAFRKPAAVAAKPDRSAENLAGAYLSTFALTITNPVTILAFLGVFAAIGFRGASGGGGEATLVRAGLLVAGVLTGSLLWWLALSLGAGLFRRSFTERHLLWLNRSSGTILTVSGATLLASLIYDIAG